MQERGHWGVLRMALLALPELQSMQFNIRFETRIIKQLNKYN